MEIIHLDHLTDICGHFYTDKAVINNGYNCRHPECDSGEHADRNNDIVDIKFLIRRHITRGKLNFKKRVLKKKQKKYIEALKSSKKWEKKLNIRWVGSCYSFSCPIAGEADLEDLKLLDKDLYNEWKNEGYGPEESGGDYMVYCHNRLYKSLKSQTK